MNPLFVCGFGCGNDQSELKVQREEGRDVWWALMEKEQFH
jgi:hypothetical protein